MGLLRQESGKALDPRVVQTFVDMYATLAAEAEASQEPARKLTRVPTHAPTAAPAVGLVDETSSAARTNVFQDIALAHREIYALYEIAQAMGSSLGVSDTMALISSKLEQHRPVLVLRAVPLQRRVRNAALPLRDRRRSRCHPAADDPQRPRPHRLGGAEPPAARQRAAEHRSRSGGRRLGSHDAQFGAGLPAAVQRAVHRHDLRLPHRVAIYTDDHRRLLDRISEQAAAVIYNSMVFEQTQEDSLTDPLTSLPNMRFMFMDLTRELSRAERLKPRCRCWSWTSTTSRTSTIPTGTMSATARCAKSWVLRDGIWLVPTSATDEPATSSSWCSRMVRVKRRKR